MWGKRGGNVGEQKDVTESTQRKSEAPWGNTERLPLGAGAVVTKSIRGCGMGEDTWRADRRAMWRRPGDNPARARAKRARPSERSERAPSNEHRASASMLGARREAERAVWLAKRCHTAQTPNGCAWHASHGERAKRARLAMRKGRKKATAKRQSLVVGWERFPSARQTSL